MWADETPLHQAARKGHTEVVKILLNAGGRTNAKGRYGITPLHWAARWGQTEVVEPLLDAGADINPKDKDGKTPLDKTKDRTTWIDPKNQAECAELLRKHGAKTGIELDAEAKQGKK